MISPLERDLSHHFSDNLWRVIQDAMDTSNRAGVNSKIYSSFLFAHLLNQAVLGSMALEMSEKEFVFACRTIHRRVTKKLEDKVAPKQNRQPK